MLHRSAWMSLVVGVGSLALSVAWLVSAQTAVLSPPVPGWPGGPIVALQARLPAIRELAHFEINALNPFVPWQQREIESRPGPARAEGRGGRQAPQVPDPQPVPYAPRTKAEAGGDAPQLRGLLAGAQPQVQVWLPAEGRTAWIALGASVAGWRLTAVEHETVAVLRHTDGRELRLVVGER